MPAEAPALGVGLLLSDDMMFTSRVTGTAKDVGGQVAAARNAKDLEALARERSPSCIIIDLANPGLDLPALVRDLTQPRAARPYIVAYGSHVDAAALAAARSAGCDLVLPRSKFVNDLPKLLPQWLAERA
jgi:CheY-like chemotaxis protein